METPESMRRHLVHAAFERTNKNILVWSGALFFLIMPIGPIGHHIVFFIVCCTYSVLTIYILNDTESFKVKLIKSLIPLIYPIVFYFPIQIIFDDAQLSIPSTAAYFLSVGFGILIYSVQSKYRLLPITLFAAITIFVSTKGYDLWLHKLNFGTYSGVVDEVITNVQLPNDKGEKIVLTGYNDEIIVLDFWTTSCGYCFQKFPVFDQIRKEYADVNGRVKFFAVNVPISRDKTGEALQIANGLPYGFSYLFSPNEDFARLLNVNIYPTVILIKNGRILYRGDVEGVSSLIRKLSLNWNGD